MLYFSNVIDTERSLQVTQRTKLTYLPVTVFQASQIIFYNNLIFLISNSTPLASSYWYWYWYIC